MSQQISAEEQVLGIVTNHWQAHGVSELTNLQLGDWRCLEVLQHYLVTACVSQSLEKS